jgi:hypothetical protein
VLAPSRWIGKPNSSNAPGPEPAREHRRAEPPQAEALGRIGVERLRLADVRPSEPALEGDLAEAADDVRMPLVTPRDALVEVACEDGLTSLRAKEMAEEGNAHAVERPVMEVVPAAVAARLDVSRQARRRVRQRFDAIVQVARLAKPPGQVVVTDPPRRPAGAPAREEDVAARLVKLLRDLTAALAASDHEHRAGSSSGLR